MAGVPLWRRLGATDPKVPISWTVTRAAPSEMARAAAQAAETHGVQAFKVKTGQGLATDRTALRDIRRAVGDDAALYADANAADRAADVPEIANMLADHGVRLLEDPCNFAPNDGFRAIRAGSRLPILVDNGCRSIAEAGLYLDVGAEARSVKVMKTGITESRTITHMAQARHARVAVGISAATSLGALNALALSASLPAETRCAPCEETFFAGMDDILLEPLRIKDGQVELPPAVGHEPLVDWAKLSSLRAS
jgi:L-alanine-DL-glutamate epimerase-like enolase superfamily enzyme